MLRLGCITTGRGEGSLGFLKTVISSIENGDLEASIEFVFSNREFGEGEGSDNLFKFVEGKQIPLVTFSSSKYRIERGGGYWSKFREDYHSEVVEKLSIFNPQISVLAGYLLITGKEMIREMPMINLHPALPNGPSGTWIQVINELINSTADDSGVMVHSVTDTLDEGPILSWCSYPIKGKSYDPLWKDLQLVLNNQEKKNFEESKLFRKIREDGIMYERPLLLKTLMAMATREINVYDGNLIDRLGNPVSKNGLCLDAEVRQMLNSNGLS